MLLTIWAYLRYVRTPSARRFLPVVVLFGLGLMAKPMLVTLPFLLLLLDYWPLGRTRASHPRALVLEKLPLVILAAASGAVTYLVQRHGGAVGSWEAFPLQTRIANAATAYVLYLAKAVWPARLAFFYPYPEPAPPAWHAAAAALLLVIVTAAVLVARRRRPFLPVGWLWYLVTLAPVIGIIQVGEQSMADRYTYVPLIGIAVLASWAVLESRFKTAGVIAGSVALAGLGVLAHRQVRTWENDRTLCEHALRVTQGNFKAHMNLGLYYERRGDLVQALHHDREGVALRPNHERHFSLGNVYRELGDRSAAIEQYQAALRFRPDFAPALNNLGAAYFENGNLQAAAECYRRSIASQPDNPEPRCNLGLVYERTGLRAQALSEYRAALHLRPDYAAARANIDRLLSTRHE
jgi:Flp pilus assembly protein TadD